MDTRPARSWMSVPGNKERFLVGRPIVLRAQRLLELAAALNGEERN